MNQAPAGPCPKGLLLLLVPIVLSGPSSPAWAQDPVPLPATEQVQVLRNDYTARSAELLVHPTDPQILYWAIGDIGVLKSTDGGATWAPRNYGLPGLGTTEIIAHPDDPDHLLLGFGILGQSPRPYRSLDGGERWEPTVVCEREDGETNLRLAIFDSDLSFDPTDPDRLYHLVSSRTLACGGFYRSCDQGATYDRNPRCIPDPEPRPACSQSDPEPVNSYQQNDATIVEVHPDSGVLFVGTSVHTEATAVMTSYDKGGLFVWEDVVDARGTFLDPAEQGVAGLFAHALELAPTDGDIRYAAPMALSGRCWDDKAWVYYGHCPDPPPETPARNHFPPMVVRWFGEMSGSVDCEEGNDCDGDPEPDRVWRPIYDTTVLGVGTSSKLTGLLPHAQDPNRLFVGTTDGKVLMLSPWTPEEPAVTPWLGEVLLDDPALFIASFTQDPNDPDRFYVLARPYNQGIGTIGNSIYRISSSDGWSTWETTLVVESTDVIHVYDLEQTFGDDGHRIIVADTTSLWIGDELGTSFDQGLPHNVQVTQLAVAPSDPDRVYAKRDWHVLIGTTGFDSVQYMDNAVWRRFVMCTNIFHQLVVDPDDSAVLYAATGAGIWRHPNAREPDSSDPANDQEAISNEWEPRAHAGDGLGDEYVWSLAFDIDPASHDRMLAGTRSGRVYESTDRGLSWNPAPTLVPPELADELRDARDIRTLGDFAYAATSVGVFSRAAVGQPWTISFQGDRTSDLGTGVTGSRRVYAAGDQAIYRTHDAGTSWEPLPVEPQGPYSRVMESQSRDGRHHLWVPDFRRGLYRVSTTMYARASANLQSVVLEWTEDEPFDGYLLGYGTDPDLLQGTDAVEGPSPIILPAGTTSTTLSGLDFENSTIYVALKGGRDGLLGPRGLPLEVKFDVAFSPRVSVTGMASCPKSIRLDWHPVPEALSYRIYRSSDGSEGPFVLYQTVPPTETAYDDLTVSDHTTYWYYMTTEFSGGETGGGNIDEGATADDFDRDGHDNCTDCAPADGSAFEPPPEVSGLKFTDDPSLLAWNKLHPGPRRRDTYDILRGENAGLPVGPEDETCLESDHESTSYTDTTIPALGAGLFYLVRGRNVCGVGSYGFGSLSDERLTSACP